MESVSQSVNQLEPTTWSSVVSQK